MYDAYSKKRNSQREHIAIVTLSYRKWCVAWQWDLWVTVYIFQRLSLASVSFLFIQCSHKPLNKLSSTYTGVSRRIFKRYESLSLLSWSLLLLLSLNLLIDTRRDWSIFSLRVDLSFLSFSLSSPLLSSRFRVRKYQTLSIYKKLKVAGTKL